MMSMWLFYVGRFQVLCCCFLQVYLWVFLLVMFCGVFLFCLFICWQCLCSLCKVLVFRLLSLSSVLWVCWVLCSSLLILMCSVLVLWFWVFWMRKIMRKVMMVVEVLIISCQVLLKLKNGLLIVYVRINLRVMMKVGGWLFQLDRCWVNWEKFMVVNFL